MNLTAGEFDYVRDLVRRRSAIVLENGKEYLAEFRLTTLARREGYESLASLIARLRAEPDGPLHRLVVEAMTTNETSFFRDQHPFAALRSHVLPRLIERRAAERRLTIWCAASSSGQEPYTIAMVMKEYFPSLESWSVRIVATDLSREMVERTRAGRYSQLEVNRGLLAPFLVKYFERQGIEWQVKEPLRRMVEVHECNLAEVWPVMAPIDIVFMRNVLIYFDLAQKRSILAKVRRVLRPDGYLFLGATETTINIDPGYRKEDVAKSSVYRVVAPDGDRDGVRVAKITDFPSID